MERGIIEIIEAVVRDRFPDADIDSVTVETESDYADDRAFRVTVVFGQKGLLDSGRAAGLTRHLRHKLLENQEERFPVVDFVSKADAIRNLKAAAA